MPQSKHGKTNSVLTKKSVEERFWLKVDKSGPNILKTRCWIWKSFKDAKGYGRFRYGTKGQKAHRFSYELHKGPIPNGLSICHECDNPSCTNPNHLFAGTNRENNMDRVKKGRQASGERAFAATLTNKQVLEIRPRSISWGGIRRMAKEFNVHHSTISTIRSRKIWKHI